MRETTLSWSCARNLTLPAVWTAACILFAFVLCSPTYGQDGFSVSGTVLDGATGDPLPGANVTVAGTTIGTATDIDGQYALEAPSPEDSLQFSYVGYEGQTLAIDGRATIDVELAPATLTGSELVVVGYATQQRQDLTGSVEVVDVDELTKIPTGQVAQQLQGHVSGVTIVSSGQPGAEPMVNIRGFNTFGDNTPLYVIDGVPTQNISTLNPNNVATLQVLKDASASIYGSRASNGVIIITTKEGRGEVSVTYDSYVGYQVPDRDNVWDILRPQGMADLRWLAYNNTGQDPGNAMYGNAALPVLPDYIAPEGLMEGDPAADPSRYNVNPLFTSADELGDFYRISRANLAGTDWYREITQPATTTSNNLSVSGGGDLGNYFLSLGYLNEQGTLMGTYLERYTIRANTEFNVGDHIRIGENLAYSMSENPTIAALSEGSAIGMSYREHPLIPVHDIMGNFAGSFGTNLTNARNPVAQQHRNRNNEGRGNRLFGNVYAEADFLGAFLARTSFGGEVGSGYYHSFAYPTYENAENINIPPSYFENAWNGYTWTWSNTLTYQQTFSEAHDVTVLAGGEVYNNTGREVGGSTSDYFSYNPDFWNLNTGSGTQTNYSFSYGNALVSVFGRLDYSYDSKYLLGLTLRRDGSSKFLENRYGVFPAVSGAWRISQESFMDGISWLTDLKIRGSYGVMGNQLNVDPNNPFTLFVGSPTSSYYAIGGGNGSLAQGFEQGRIGNPSAKWERDISTNFGFDAALFGGRLEATFDYYQKDVEGLLFNPALPGTAGAAEQPFINVGSMRNNGIDLSLRGATNLAQDLGLNATLNFTTYNNEIVAIAEGYDSFGAEPRRFGIPIIRNAVGHPLSSYYGYQIEGFWDSEGEIEDADAGAPSGEYQTDAGVGRFRYADIDGDGEITNDDRTFLGSPNPDFTYGLNLGLTYRSWDFSMFVYGVQGNEVWNQVKWWTDFYASFAGAKSNTALYDSWTPDNQDAEVAIQETVASFSTYQVPNSYFVEDGSYLRIRSMQLGYTLPSRLVQGIGGESLRVYVQAANLFTFTSYSGIDPEIGSNDAGDVVGFGIDEGAYATPRQFLFGVNLSF